MCNWCKCTYMKLNKYNPEYHKQYRKNNSEIIKQKRFIFRLNNQNRICLNNAKSNARKKNLPFNLELSDIIVPKYCPILGIELIPAKGNKTDNSPSVDRIIPELGYVKGNIIVISLKANQLKSNGTIEEHEKVLNWMKINGCKIK